MHFRLTMVLCALIPFVYCAHTAKPSQGGKPFTEPKTLIALPSELCGMVKTETTRDPQKRPIVTVNFQNVDLKYSASCLFDGGATYVMDGAEDTAVKANLTRVLEGIVDMERLGRYTNVSIIKQETIPIDIKENSQDALFAECDYTDLDTDKKCYILATAFREQIVRIRFAFPVFRKSEADAVWGCVLRSLH